MDKEKYQKIWGNWVISIRKDARRVCFIKFTNVATGLSFKFKPSNQTPFMEYDDSDMEMTIGSNLTTNFLMRAIREFYENES